MESQSSGARQDRQSGHFFELGIVGGMLLGLLFDNLAMGMALGMSVGLAVDWALNRQHGDSDDQRASR